MPLARLLVAGVLVSAIPHAQTDLGQPPIGERIDAFADAVAIRYFDLQSLSESDLQLLERASAWELDELGPALAILRFAESVTDDEWAAVEAAATKRAELTFALLMACLDRHRTSEAARIVVARGTKPQSLWRWWEHVIRLRADHDALQKAFSLALIDEFANGDDAERATIAALLDRPGLTDAGLAELRAQVEAPIPEEFRMPTPWPATIWRLGPEGLREIRRPLSLPHCIPHARLGASANGEDKGTWGALAMPWGDDFEGHQTAGLLLAVETLSRWDPETEAWAGLEAVQYSRESEPGWSLGKLGQHAQGTACAAVLAGLRARAEGAEPPACLNSTLAALRLAARYGLQQLAVPRADRDRMDDETDPVGDALSTALDAAAAAARASLELRTDRPPELRGWVDVETDRVHTAHWVEPRTFEIATFVRADLVGAEFRSQHPEDQRAGVWIRPATTVAVSKGTLDGIAREPAAELFLPMPASDAQTAVDALRAFVRPR